MSEVVWSEGRAEPFPTSTSGSRRISLVATGAEMSPFLTTFARRRLITSPVREAVREKVDRVRVSTFGPNLVIGMEIPCCIWSASSRMIERETHVSESRGEGDEVHDGYDRVAQGGAILRQFPERYLSVVDRRHADWPVPGARSVCTRSQQ